MLSINLKIIRSDKYPSYWLHKTRYFKKLNLLKQATGNKNTNNLILHHENMSV